MTGIQKVRLNNLNPNLKNGLVIGIVIAKNSPRVIGSKKKNGESRGVTSFTLRDSYVDTINVDVWGSEYFVLTFYERFLVGDVVEISTPKICVKSGTNELFRPLVSSPFYLSLNEGLSDVSIHSGETFSSYLPLLHIPTKLSSGYYGLADVLKLPESSNVFVDLLVVVKSIKPAKTIRTKTGTDMSVRTVEIMDNTTPASLQLDMFDIDTIQRQFLILEMNQPNRHQYPPWFTQEIRSKLKIKHYHLCKYKELRQQFCRAEEWRTLESVLFIADGKVSWRGLAVKVQVCARSVITHQPHTAEAEALQLYIRNQANTPGGGEAAAWAAWSGERASAASVAQIRDRLASAVPFCASLHALLTHLDLDELNSLDNSDELRVRFTDHTGELNALLPINTLGDTLGYSSEQLRTMSADDRAAIRWKILLEQCTAKIAASTARLIVLTLRRASPADPIPLY